MDCMAREPYEYTIDYKTLTLFQSMQLIALTQISLADLPSIERLIKRSKNMRVKYRRRIEKSGWEEIPVLRLLDWKEFWL